MSENSYANQQPQYGQPQYGTAPSGQPQYAQASYGESQFGAPQYAQNQYAQTQYAQTQFGQPVGYQQPGYFGGFQPGGLEKSHVAAILLSFFLGGLGVDRMYLGRVGLGVAKLFLNVFTAGIWALVDFILIIMKNVRPPAGYTHYIWN